MRERFGDGATVGIARTVVILAACAGLAGASTALREHRVSGVAGPLATRLVAVRNRRVLTGRIDQGSGQPSMLDGDRVVLERWGPPEIDQGSGQPSMLDLVPLYDPEGRMRIDQGSGQPSMLDLAWATEPHRGARVSIKAAGSLQCSTCVGRARPHATAPVSIKAAGSLQCSTAVGAEGRAPCEPIDQGSGQPSMLDTRWTCARHPAIARIDQGSGQPSMLDKKKYGYRR